MGEKDLKIMVGDNLSISDDVKFTVVSTIQSTPNEKPIVKTFKLSDSTDEIVAGTFRGLEEAGYRLEPKRVNILKRTVEDIKELGVSFKVSGNLSLEGGAGGSFEKSPSKQTEKHTEYQVEISFEVIKKD